MTIIPLIRNHHRRLCRRCCCCWKSIRATFCLASFSKNNKKDPTTIKQISKHINASDSASAYGSFKTLTMNACSVGSCCWFLRAQDVPFRYNACCIFAYVLVAHTFMHQRKKKLSYFCASFSWRCWCRHRRFIAWNKVHGKGVDLIWIKYEIFIVGAHFPFHLWVVCYCVLFGLHLVGVWLICSFSLFLFLFLFLFSQ